MYSKTFKMKINIISLVMFSLIPVFYSCMDKKEKIDKYFIPESDNGGILLPENFGAIVVADSIGRGRHLTVNENGDIYIHLRKLTDSGHGIIAMRDSSGDGRADIKAGFSEITGTGIELHNNFLYYSSRTEVYRSPLVPGELLPSYDIDTLVHLGDG